MELRGKRIVVVVAFNADGDARRYRYFDERGVVADMDNWILQQRYYFRYVLTFSDLSHVLDVIGDRFRRVGLRLALKKFLDEYKKNGGKLK